MDARNQSAVAEFILLGFNSLQRWQAFLFFTFFLLAYALTIMANATIIATVWKDSRLHTPMYFFLSNFSFMEIWYTTVTVPKMLSSFMVERTTISVSGCIIQFYVFFCLGTTECMFMGVMAYDRYIAICYPLRYNTLMNKKVCTQLAIGSWVSGFIGHLPLTISTTQFFFCGPNKINHFYCDLAPVLNLSCTDTSVSERIFFTFAWVIILCSFLLTMMSYCYIISTICRMPSTTGRQRAFSTCASHLTVVTIFYSTVTFMYVRPTVRYTFQADKVVSIFYCVVTPLLNPVIYNLRNKEMKEALRRVLCSRRMMNCKKVGLINWDS
ncbi:olfactory receptor 6B1-like [Malaclemys terrapin pileata]|uniref:olfactory receptor 6B1-like n=1 Tax=Malaclemys terrapin pileata TaxID=2991368 RepID=UPI0023A80089|nr:olfactory receptor 6B1-like [Malaclemys terrapin pileata]